MSSIDELIEKRIVMNTSKALNIVLAVAILFLSIKMSSNNKEKEMENENIKENVSSESVVESIMTRSSIRSYQDRKLDKKQIETLLRAGMAAPSAMNKQPWQIIVVDDIDILGNLSWKFPNAKMVNKAALAIIVCGDLSLAIEGEGEPYWIQDCSAVTENILLAAHGMGLGAVWCGIYPISERVDTLRAMLELPDNIIPLNIIPVGYPEGEPVVKDKWDEKKVHYNKW